MTDDAQPGQAGQPAQFGRYQVIGELGRGAMGVVYRAQDPMLDRTVAIKVIFLSADVAERAEYEARFMQEAKAAGRLSHPCIITIYDVGREGDMAYMAMELLQGIDLRERLRKGRLPVQQALEIAIQVADGLGFAHEHGIVHRDIKPANIMLVRGERPKIMDFGIARLQVSDIKTQTGMLLGTPKYMSPEQVAGGAVDHRADLFSLGSVLYETLTGAPPFSGADSTQILLNVASAQQVSPSRVNPQVPPMLDLVISKVLQKDPSSRYQDAQELVADLRACLAELPDHLSRVAAAAGEATVTLADATLQGAPGASLTGEGAAAERLVSGGDSVKAAGEKTSATQVQRAGTGIEGVARLPLSRRFDSSRALSRLVEPTHDDRTLLTRAPQNQHPLLRLWRDRQQRRLVVMLSAAALLAIAIVFV